MLKHAPASELRAWGRHELRSARRAGRAVRGRKLRALVWNVRHLASVLAYRRAHAGSGAVPERLREDSWGDAFPAGVPPRVHPQPELAGERLDASGETAAGLLPYGWFPPEGSDGRRYRWATTRAAVLACLERPARLVRLDFRHVPVDLGGVEVELRSPDNADPSETVWRTRLGWQYIARSVENHPLELPPGDYELLFSATRGWSHPPGETRSLALALASVAFLERVELPGGGLDMGHPDVEEQLVSGWFEAEQGEGRSYRWAGAEARALVRLEQRVQAARIVCRSPPGEPGAVSIGVHPRDGRGTLSSTSVQLGSDWQEHTLELDLSPGEYVLAIRAERTWSNPDGSEPGLWAEARTLGFALSSFTFPPGR